ncbi:hypothetical protein B0T25DRAFT_547434 [Lasiosphaeria hispida]|uniref:Uncharacterized protein n=1 Tax=Lasiosphaeria hispida TaxID=260671 RepID=A0AAJ0MC40_9PEZI|nr:hypothetical protein B0T25DRAFT_547434 [Lasiosphaeria hispida]
MLRSGMHSTRNSTQVLEDLEVKLPLALDMIQARTSSASAGPSSLPPTTDVLGVIAVSINGSVIFMESGDPRRSWTRCRWNAHLTFAINPPPPPPLPLAISFDSASRSEPKNTRNPAEYRIAPRHNVPRGANGLGREAHRLGALKRGGDLSEDGWEEGNLQADGLHFLSCAADEARTRRATVRAWHRTRQSPPSWQSGRAPRPWRSPLLVC